ncbi:lactonase family protein [Streptomyces pathocidini]|uniref:Lactonase family protein n=1 Tax=Streptomyces pathocidini TaxID=1650571 RepID=A0ABW7ULA5_9ACTN|nr:lactonase family protein [Streptomyces pathocidini]
MGTTNRTTRAYIGSFTHAGGAGITTAAVDRTTGALTAVHSTAEVPDPSFLALAPGGDVLYAVSETDDGAAAAFTLAGDRDRPVLLGEPVPVRGGAPTHLALAGGHLLTANYGSGSVTTIPLREDGSLAPAASHVLAHEGGGPHPDRQEAPHAHAVLPDPTGRWVLSVDLGTDSVRICALDPDARTLNVHREVRLRPGAGPRHLAFHPGGGLAYVVNELDPTVTALRWDAEKGELEPLGETPLLPVGADEAGATYPSEVVVAPDGRFAWAANRGHDSIAVLALDEAGGAPRPVTRVPCGGHWPRDLALDPSGRRLYAANERSGDVTWFDVDPATGIPHRAGSIPVTAASCVVFG